MCHSEEQHCIFEELIVLKKANIFIYTILIINIFCLSHYFIGVLLGNHVAYMPGIHSTVEIPSEL